MTRPQGYWEGMQMALEGCPSCAQKISVEAASCPSCGHPLGEGWAEAQATKRKEEEKVASEKRLGWTIFLLAVVGVFFAFSWQSGSGTKAACGTEVEAVSYAQILLRERLKNPSSAEFSYANTRKAMLECGRWRVSSYVDATNSFGATVRTNFTAVVRRVSKDRWVMEDLKM